MHSLNYDHFKLICQGSGLKSTSQRFIIYKSLVEIPIHPTADQLFDQVSSQLPGLARDTVYRTLGMLHDCGLARKLVMPGGATHFDGIMSPHHHFLCGDCGAIHDMDWPAFERLPRPKDWSEIGQVQQVSILIVGRCRLCLLDTFVKSDRRI